MISTFIRMLSLLLFALIVEGDAAPSCDDVPVAMRFDCFPEPDPAQNSCELRGCCWNESHTLGNKHGIVSVLFLEPQRDVTSSSLGTPSGSQKGERLIRNAISDLVYS